MTYQNKEITMKSIPIHIHYLIMVSFVLLTHPGKSLQAGGLVFEPAKPLVAVGQPVQLSVSGLVSDIVWQVLLEGTGKIEGSTSSTRVTYVAPNQAGSYWVTVVGKDNAGKIKSDLIEVSVLLHTECDKHPKCGKKDVPTKRKKALIIIRSNGGGDGMRKVSQAKTLDSLATYIYNKFQKCGHYKDDDINYLLPNGNRKTGKVTKVPMIEKATTSKSYLTVKDIETAFEWAKNQGLKKEPLILFFIGYGLPHELILASPEKRKISFSNPFSNKAGENHLISSKNVLSEQKFRKLLDKYQATTGNKVFVILEANYSGTLVDGLAKKGRVIISSTGNGLSYYDNFEQISFTKLFVEKLCEGLNAKDAWQQVVSQFKKKDYKYSFNLQNPQLKDVEGTLAQQFSLTGELPGHIARILSIYNGILVQGSRPINPYERIGWRIHRSWRRRSNVHQIKVSIKSPEANCQFNHQGHSRLPTEPIFFREDANGEWNAFYSNFTTNGKYTITVWAEDEHGNVLETQTLYQQVKGGKAGKVMRYPRLDGNQLHIPAVTVPNTKGGMDIYQAQLIRQADSDNLLFQLQSFSPVSDASQICYVHYDTFKEIAYIPSLETPNESGKTAQLRFMSETSLFELTF